MAKFTAQQVDACVFTRCESFKINGVHDFWVLAVNDENGCSYEWRDDTLPGTANLADVRAQVKPYLMSIEMKTPPAPKSVNSLEEAIGQYIGDGSPF